MVKFEWAYHCDCLIWVDWKSPMKDFIGWLAVKNFTRETGAEVNSSLVDVKASFDHCIQVLVDDSPFFPDVKQLEVIL